VAFDRGGLGDADLLEPVAPGKTSSSSYTRKPGARLTQEEPTPHPIQAYFEPGARLAIRKLLPALWAVERQPARSMQRAGALAAERVLPAGVRGAGPVLGLWYVSPGLRADGPPLRRHRTGAQPGAAIEATGASMRWSCVKPKKRRGDRAYIL